MREREKQRENGLKRTEKEIRGGIKPPESLFVFLCPFFLLAYSLFLFFFFKAFSMDWGAGSLGLLTPVPEPPSQPCPPASICPG